MDTKQVIANQSHWHCCSHSCDCCVDGNRSSQRRSMLMARWA